MRYFIRSLMLLSIVPQIAMAVDWTLSRKTDPFTDKQTSSAQYVVGGQLKPATVMVICDPPARLRAIATFGEFLGNKLVDIEFRFNREPSVKEKWIPSADGTGVIIPEERDFSRHLANGGVLNIRAWDFRGVAYSMSVPLNDAKGPVEQVLHDCNIDLDPLSAHQDLANIDKEVILNIDKWGPRRVVLTKRGLSVLGFYSGAVDDQKDVALYAAVQKFHGDFARKCDSGKLVGFACDARRRGGESDIAYEFYDLAPSSVKGELGRLHNGE